MIKMYHVSSPLASLFSSTLQAKGIQQVVYKTQPLGLSIPSTVPMSKMRGDF